MNLERATGLEPACPLIRKSDIPPVELRAHILWFEIFASFLISNGICGRRGEARCLHDGLRARCSPGTIVPLSAHPLLAQRAAELAPLLGLVPAVQREHMD
jgi:hypothetical protein